MIFIYIFKHEIETFSFFLEIHLYKIIGRTSDNTTKTKENSKHTTTKNLKKKAFVFNKQTKK